MDMSRLATRFEERQRARDHGRGKRGGAAWSGQNRLIVEVNTPKRHDGQHPGRHQRMSVHAQRRRAGMGANPRGHAILGDGRKVRVCRKCEGVVDK